MNSVRWLSVFSVFYFCYLLLGIDPLYLDSDQASHAMTGLFVNKLFGDWINNPTFNPSSLYDYFKAYYVRYPKLVPQYGPVYPLINALFGTQLLMKVGSCLMATGIIILVYFIVKELFSERVALLSSIIAAASTIFVSVSRTISPNIPSVFFFTLGLFFYYKSDSNRHLILAGLFFGLSVLAKEFALIFVASICLISLKDKSFKDCLKMYAVISLTLLPYIGLLYFSGSINILFDYPAKQAWYGVQNQDPQWTELGGWTYFFQVIAENHSIIGLIFFLAGLVYVYKSPNKNLVYLFLLVFLAITFVSDKANRRLLYFLPVIAGLISLSINKIYSVVSKKSLRTVLLFTITLMMVLSLPLVNAKVNIPFKTIANELISSCPNCTILIASEVGRVYSSYLMYESMIIDENVSLRFIRPTVFHSSNAFEVINLEKVNRVIVIGEVDFLRSNPENIDYFAQIDLIMNRYDVIGVYDSDIVGKIYVLDTGINEFKEPPYCFSSISMSRDFCSDHQTPIEVFA